MIPKIIESDVMPEGELWLLPNIKVETPLPLDGDLLSSMQVAANVYANELIVAAKRGEVAIIRGLKL